MKRPATIAFSWNGLPQYAARLMRAAIQRLGCDCIVVGSRPSVPVEGMEQALGQKILWVQADKPVRWRDLGLDPPRVFFQSGWAYPAFISLGQEVKSSGGFVIGLSDANWRGDFRQLVLGLVAFRMLRRPQFDAMLVPGRQGFRLMRYYGIPADRVRTGMYGADPVLFGGGPPLDERPKSFLYVGQFIARKNVLSLVESFLRFSALEPGWTLRIIGSGELRSLIPADRRIVVEDFLQPEQLADRYRQSRFFVLPSLVEAWGLVVHEAALCGCGLVLSDAIGSGDDLADAMNSVRFSPGSIDALERALYVAASFDAAALRGAEAVSRRFAEQFGPERFASAAEELVRMCVADLF
jgi:glycosyltransferase involved in cell wall biosynthesis